VNSRYNRELRYLERPTNETELITNFWGGTHKNFQLLCGSREKKSRLSGKKKKRILNRKCSLKRGRKNHFIFNFKGWGGKRKDTCGEGRKVYSNEKGRSFLTGSTGEIPKETGNSRKAYKMTTKGV